MTKKVHDQQVHVEATAILYFLRESVINFGFPPPKILFFDQSPLTRDSSAVPPPLEDISIGLQKYFYCFINFNIWQIVYLDPDAVGGEGGIAGLCCCCPRGGFSPSLSICSLFYSKY